MKFNEAVWEVRDYIVASNDLSFIGFRKLLKNLAYRHRKAR